MQCPNVWGTSELPLPVEMFGEVSSVNAASKPSATFTLHPSDTSSLLLSKHHIKNKSYSTFLVQIFTATKF